MRVTSERYHTNEVIPHLLQNGLHVLTGQALGAHKTLQHPKHAPKTFFGAEKISNDLKQMKQYI